MSAGSEKIEEVQGVNVDAQGEALRTVVAKYWGYDTFRPLQREAMQAALDRRDSLVVLPTGGGKSLCYQAPALVGDGLTVVVSPLIALMKDQVDALLNSGVAAAQLNSSLSYDEQKRVEDQLLNGTLRLLFLSPERLAQSSCRSVLRRAGVRSFAIDEAHCISHWGHDFRPEYRQLARLREIFPCTSVHAYTATATARVREDIVEQLSLRDPLVLVGDFDRPNLTYRVVPRRRAFLEQIDSFLQRHKGEAAIVYCIRRKDVDDVALALSERGYRVAGYHAGMTQDQRRSAQESFASEGVDIVVATVAFGMGIDRSNVRLVLHMGMPKSVEHYQQEAGRAGRDGLEAECVLLFSAADAMTWRTIIENSAGEAPSPDFLSTAYQSIDQMVSFCSPGACRHRTLVEHFGQTWTAPSCNACDTCLGDFQPLDDGDTVARKILSCVVRLREPYGAAYLCSVLRGESLARIRERGHDALSTWGILRGFAAAQIREWIAQLVAHGHLRQDPGAYPLLHLTPSGRDVLQGHRPAGLMERKDDAVALSDRELEQWSGVDRDLFELLREWRRSEAERRGVPAFVLFSDLTLRDLARVRPSALHTMRSVQGVGDHKLEEFGQQITAMIRAHCVRRDLPMNVGVPLDGGSRRRAPANAAGAAADTARAAFRRGASVEEVVQATGRARSTVSRYLAAFIVEEGVSIEPWVDSSTAQRIMDAAVECGIERLKPIWDRLGGEIAYDDIRLVLASAYGIV